MVRALSIIAVLGVGICSLIARASNDCNKILTAYDVSRQIAVHTNQSLHLSTSVPYTQHAYGTLVPILRSFEKEGLFYEEISLWFPHLAPSGVTKLLHALHKENVYPSGKRKPFTRFLENLKLAHYPQEMPLKTWQTLTIEERLSFLTNYENPFDLLKISDREELFELNVINFNDLLPGPLTPNNLEIGDDLGSYELRSQGGEADRTTYLNVRAQAEAYLDGRVGHQHLFHAWPESKTSREAISREYIELLDASTWYLFWRQMRRNPNDSESILTHPFLGVYTKASLERLHSAFLNNEPKKFKDKFRLVGARNFPARDDVKEQANLTYVPDWELRSGNKGIKRDFIESAIASRLITGDYSGLKPFNAYAFDASTPIESLATSFLTKDKIQSLKLFEESHPALEFLEHKNAKNHNRNKIMAPLLPWLNRLPIHFKSDLLLNAQKEYAETLYLISQKFLKKIKKPLNNIELGDVRAEAIEDIEVAIYKFANKVRLDLDFEAYLTPQPQKLPSITVENLGPINVNAIDLGIEYSFRFQTPVKPKKLADARELLSGFAAELSPGHEVAHTDGDSHGHGTVVKYKVKDSDGLTWRIEWDGIQRYYVDGKVRRAWGGHMEVVSPKFHPQTLDDSSVKNLFATARQNGFLPKRHAGGAHVTFDLEPLEKLPQETGTKKLLNLISYFESEREVILFMWQHPLRTHAALPINLSPDFAQKVAEFKGDWEALGRLLYEERYFNPYIGRKPKYAPLNLTPVMTPILPDQYLTRPLDIRNNKEKWFPSFNKVTGRVEARFFDAPLDEYMAALQIKYWRALMNKAFNTETHIPLIPRHSKERTQAWTTYADAWIKAATEHLLDLGLDPKEFEPLLWDSWHNRNRFQERERELVPYDQFLPAKDISGRLSLFTAPQNIFAFAA